VKIEKKAKIGDLKEKLAEMTGKKPNTLLLADVYNHKIFQLLDDRSNVSNIRDTDVTAAYEIIPQANATKDNILYIQVYFIVFTFNISTIMREHMGKSQNTLKKNGPSQLL